LEEGGRGEKKAVFKLLSENGEKGRWEGKGAAVLYIYISWWGEKK